MSGRHTIKKNGELSFFVPATPYQTGRTGKALSFFCKLFVLEHGCTAVKPGHDHNAAVQA